MPIKRRAATLDDHCTLVTSNWSSDNFYNQSITN